MTGEPTHRVTADDGTQVAARVNGQGPALVLVHGAFEDGATCWASLVPLLAERFTCHAIDLRGRGLSGRSNDLSPERLVRDVVTYVEGVAGPVGLVGESGGGALALGAAARTPAVAALALHEPAVTDVMPAQEAAAFERIRARVEALADEGRRSEALVTFAEWVGNDEELAALASAEDEVEALAVNVPVQLEEFRQAFDRDGPGPADPSALAGIDVPVLLLHGTRTAQRSWFTAGVHHVADHVTDVRVVELAGTGHFAPALAPEPIADELLRFFTATLPPA